MAKMIRNKRCVICGESPVLMWTIDNMSKVAVTYLCFAHGSPLQEVMNIAGDLAPDEQVPVPERGFELDIHQRGRAMSKMAPLMNWTPPEDPGPEPEPVAEPGPVAEPEPQPEREAWVVEEVDSGFEPKVEPTVTIIKIKSPEQIAEETTVAKARADGKTWTEVAELVGTSRQNLHQKYGKTYAVRGRNLPEEPEPEPEPVVEVPEVVSGVSVEEFVKQGRSEGKSWTAIGRLLGGVPGEELQRRFPHLRRPRSRPLRDVPS